MKPLARRGVCVWLTGLPASGKSTTATVLIQLLQGRGIAAVLLDGDALRATVSAGLGFTREDRETHLRRVGALAAQHVHRGEVAVCATVSPYRSIRQVCRALVGGDSFVEVFVDTPVDLCRRRDPKGLYERAARGEILHFTGVSAPYEPPLAPEITLETRSCTAQENARRVLDYLTEKHFLDRGAAALRAP